MKRITITLIGAFLMFFFAGYLLGIEHASMPDRISALIANNTNVVLKKHKLIMTFRGDSKQIYWTHDLESNSEKFERIEGLLSSLKPDSISAEGKVLMAFLGSGAVAAYTGKDLWKLIEQELKEVKTKRKVDRNILNTLAALTGFSIGYNIGRESVKLDSPEVLSFFRKKANVEKIKRLVFVSMLLDSGYDPTQTTAMTLPEVESTNILDCVNKNPKSRVMCLNLEVTTEAKQKLFKLITINEAMKTISTDDKNLEGYEFLIFFI